MINNKEYNKMILNKWLTLSDYIAEASTGYPCDQEIFNLIDDLKQKNILDFETNEALCRAVFAYGQTIVDTIALCPFLKFTNEELLKDEE